MANVTEVNRGRMTDSFEMNLCIAGFCVAVIAVFASGFYPAVERSGSLSINARILAALQFADSRIFLEPIANHPWKALLVAALAAYALPLYGLLTKRFRDKDKRSNALWFVPGMAAALGVTTFATADFVGGTDGGQIRSHSWLALSGLLAVLTVAFYTWFFALKRGPRSLEDLHKNPHLYEVEDFRGAAMAKDLAEGPRPLLLRFPWCDWPNMGNANVQRKLAGRLVIGRFYEHHERTNYWVCPAIEDLQQTLVVAPPGAGKTYSIALPWGRELPLAGHSAFVIDVKGDMAATLWPSFKQSQIPLYSFNPEDPGSLKWNPFDEIDRSDATEVYNGAENIARAIFGEISTHDKYWDLSELGYLRAAVELLIRTNPNPTPTDLADLLRTQEKLITTLTLLSSQLNTQPDQFSREDRRAIEEVERGLQLLVSDAELKRTGYYERIQGAFIKFALFNNHRIARITKGSQFRLRQLTQEPSVMVFAAPLSLGLDSSTLAAIAVRFLQQLIYARFKERPQRKLFFILDEFSKLQLSAKEMEHFVSTSRSAGCVSVIILQSVDQLADAARTELLDNLADRYILHGAGPATARWFEHSLHDRMAMRATASQDHRFSARNSATGFTTSITETSVPVLAAREIHNTGGLQHGAWLRLAKYSSKPILVDLERPAM